MVILRLTFAISLCLGNFVSGIAKPVFDGQDTLIKVLVLPPHDAIANAGISPDIQKIMEGGLSENSPFSIVPFPFKKLLGVPYQMVFDKKYCAPILEKIQCDVIIMSQLITDNERKPGHWPWSYRIKIYNVRTGKQINSIRGDELTGDRIREDFQRKIQLLIHHVLLSFNEQVIISILGHNWKIEGIESKASGYFTKDDDSFDLRDLKLKDQVPGEGDLYIDTSEFKILIRIHGSESYYEVEHLGKNKMKVISYFIPGHGTENNIILAIYSLVKM